MSRLIKLVGQAAGDFWQDTRGIMLPYVTLIILVIVGLATLALDGGRYGSLQTQMQAAADALAIAGARELDQNDGARVRAAAAMADVSVGNTNTLSGLGTKPTFSFSHTFYSALPDATTGFTGTAATNDADTRFVAVTVTPVSVPTIFPIPYIAPGMASTMTSGGRAIAGFTSKTVCNIPPVFICNPYETAGLTDAQATEALRTALDDPAITRKQLRMTMDNTSPGHFGWLVPPDQCNGASCLENWLALADPGKRACYTKSGVDMNPGNKQSVKEVFNLRFDIPFKSYTGSDYAPSVNVRKGYLPASGANRWCNANAAKGYTLGNSVDMSASYTKMTPIVTVTGTVTKNSGGGGKKGPASDPKVIESVSSTAAVIDGCYITGTGIPADTRIVSHTTSSPLTITINNNATVNQTGVTLTITCPVAGLPMDKTFTGFQGDGDWNCHDYWKINHGDTVPSGCTTSSPTWSRYEIYRKEIADSLVGDWSGNGIANDGPPDKGYGESGAPLCTGSGIDPVGNDRRIIYAAIINCTAQAGLIGGGATADNIPVADYGKFFISQPVGADGTDYLYGEMTGLVGSLDKVQQLNQVQLYR